MTIAGWIFMIVSWAVILILFAFCMFRTLRPQDKQENNPQDNQSIETPPQE